LSHTELDGEIDDGNDVATEIDHAPDGRWSLWHDGESAVLDDLFDFQNADGVLLAGEMKRQVLGMVKAIFFSFM
jgi:hypothetical protein